MSLIAGFTLRSLCEDVTYVDDFEIIFDAQRTKRTLMHFAGNVDPDQRAHLCSLIWTLSVHRHILQYPLIL